MMTYITYCYLAYNLQSVVVNFQLVLIATTMISTMYYYSNHLWYSTKN